MAIVISNEVPNEFRSVNVWNEYRIPTVEKERSLVLSDMRLETIDSRLEPIIEFFSEIFTLQYMTYLYV